MLNFATSKIISIAGWVIGVATITGGTIYLININNKETKTTVAGQKQEVIEENKNTETPKSIRQGLEGSGSTLLGNSPSDEALWDQKGKSFQEANKPNVLGGEGTMEKGSEKQVAPNAPQEFKDLCKSNSEKEVPNKSHVLYAKVVEYCTKNS